MKRILVVDDENATNVLSSGYLRLAGFEVESCFDGESAQERLGREPSVDLVVLDLRMPGIGGAAAARAMRSDPRTALIPIVLLSATLGLAAGTGIEEVKADAYIPKPFSPQHLAATVKKLLSVV